MTREEVFSTEQLKERLGMDEIPADLEFISIESAYSGDLPYIKSRLEECIKNVKAYNNSNEVVIILPQEYGAGIGFSTNDIKNALADGHYYAIACYEVYEDGDGGYICLRNSRSVFRRAG